MKSDGEKVLGCLGGMWVLFVQLPLWLFLMHGILSSVDAPNRVWVLFYIYIPVSIGSGLVHTAIKALED